jgi:hypothetical protein
VFFSAHYGLALLDIMVDFEPALASFGPSSQCGQEVLVLGRGESLMARRGTILFLEEPSLGRNHNMFLSCKIPEVKNLWSLDAFFVVVNLTQWHFFDTVWHRRNGDRR